MTVDNTTGDSPFGAGATASKLTGFAFEVPDLVSLVSYTGNSPHLPNLLTNDSSVRGGMFNGITFDYGAGLGTTLMSNGNPSNGLGSGDGTVDVVFLLKGMTESAMASAFAGGFGDGSLALGLRFKQVTGGSTYSGADSDKMLYVPDDNNNNQEPLPTPVPAGGVLLFSALAAVVMVRRKKS